MNTILLKHKPVDVDNKEFAKVWSNAGYSLQALYGALHELKAQLQVVKADDFDCPNHYAKLAYQAGYFEALKLVQDMLPDSSKP